MQITTLSKKIFLFLFLLFLFSPVVSSQNQRFTISGNISDASTGEDIIGANIYAFESKNATTTNVYGFFSITLPEGKSTLRVSYLGYEQQEIRINLFDNQRLNIRLQQGENILKEVVVSSEAPNHNIISTEMSVEKLSSKIIKAIPAMMGEADVMKAMQLLPGVQSVSEGSSNFSVRGGSYDQNLILLDEATVYSASHLMGFFSVFNTDVIKDVKLYKGDIPAAYGGRLSSLMDVRTKDGNNQKLSVTGGLGTISSRLAIEGPITEKSSFIVSGRRTYADIFLPLASDSGLHDVRLYFYDLNAKFNYRINDNNRIFLAAYIGKDRFKHTIAEMNFGNQTFTARWNHIFSPKLFSNFTLVASHYDYYLGATITEQLGQEWKSWIEDIGGKVDFSYHLNPQNEIQFGYDFYHHTFSPGEGGGSGNSSIINNFSFPNKYALDHAIYVSNETKFNEHLTLRYGLRYSLYQNLGNASKEYLLKNYVVVDSAVYERGKIYNSQSGFEPRIGANYVFDQRHSVKTSYSRSMQYIQLASNSSAGSPFDLWFQASQNVKPQISDQIAAGYFRNFSDNMFESSIELYYKNYTNVVDFKDNAILLGNEQLEQELRFGVGYSYGAELMLRKNTGKLNGWVSYTYSRSFRKIDGVNNDEWYNSPYDKPNSVTIVANYEFSPKFSVAANWVYATGAPVTYPVGRFEVEGVYVPIFSKRNEYRYPDYHRLDLSATWKLSQPKKRFQHELNFSLYNAYGRKNPWTIYFLQEQDNPNQTYAEMMYLFSFVPSITWNFSF